MLIRNLLGNLVLPPLANLLLIVLGLLVALRYRRLGRGIVAFAVVTLFVLALPWTKARLYQTLEIYPVPTAEQLQGLDPARTAIVVLGGGVTGFAPEYGKSRLKDNSLQRIYYARHVLEQVSLPVLITGGFPWGEPDSEAALMGHALGLMGVQPRWLEEQSRNTWENAVYSAALLKPAGIDTVVLVTDAWHLRRGVESFHAQGLKVLPAPTGFRGKTYDDIRTYLPETYALHHTWDALHEWLGILVYRLSHGTRAVSSPLAAAAAPAPSP